MAVTDNSALAAQINSTYLQWGGRAATSGEIAYWTGALQGGATTDTLRIAIIDDPLGRAYVPALIRSEYLAYGGRDANSDEISYWTAQMRGGNATGESLKAVLIGDALGQNYLPTAISAQYMQWGGRGATAPEITYWMGALKADGASVATLKAALLNDPLGQTYLPTLINTQYQQYGGRSATSAEIAFWSDALRAAAATADMLKHAIIDDPLGRNYLSAAISTAYQNWGGRAATSGEIAYWMGQMRDAGATADTVKTAVVNDPLGRNYLAGLVEQNYEAWGGRAASASETAYWIGAMLGGATATSIKLAILNDPLGIASATSQLNAMYTASNAGTPTSADVTNLLAALRSGQSFTDAVAAVMSSHAATASPPQPVVTAPVGDTPSTSPPTSPTSPTVSIPPVAAPIIITPAPVITVTIPPTVPVLDAATSAVVTTQYQLFAGRAPTSDELANWGVALSGNGAGAAGTVKLAILNSASGHDYAQALLGQNLTAAGYAAPVEAEVQAVLTQVRAGTGFAAADAAIVAARVDPATFHAVYDAYAAWMGRAPTGSELESWKQALAGSANPAASLKAGILATAEGQQHLGAIVQASYAAWADRAATGAEVDSWKSAIASGAATPDAIRTTLLSGTDGQAHATAAVTALFDDYQGHAPDAGSLQDSIAQLGAVQDFTVVQRALFLTTDGITHFYDVLDDKYAAVMGRDYSGDEQASWFDAIYNGTGYATMQATLMLDPNSLGAHIEGTAAADTIALAGHFGLATVASFDPAVDKVRLDASFAGVNLLDAAHAQQVMSLDGVTPNVLITLDASDTLLLHGVNLAQLSAADFLFG